MRNTKSLIYLFAILILASGCVRKAQLTLFDKPVNDQFGVIVQDRHLELNALNPDFDSQLTVDPHGQVRFQGADWLKTSEQLFETAESLGDKYPVKNTMVKMAHDISRAYYA